MGDVLGFSAKPRRDRKAEARLKEQQADERERIAEEKNDLAERKSRGKTPYMGLLATAETGVLRSPASSGQRKKKLSGIS